MSLSGSRLGGQLSTDYYSALEAAFPVNPSLLTSEKAGITADLQAFATALGSAGGPDIVSEITGNAVVPGTGLTSPSGAVTGDTTVT